MAVDRTNWAERFVQNNFPTFPCPRCQRGRMSMDKATLKFVEPVHSSLAREHNDWEPDWTQELFSLYLRCNESKCGEVVIVIGRVDVMEVEIEDFGWGHASLLRPTSMFPAPPIIKLPDDTPRKVTDNIKAAFALFWMDIGSSANSLRRSIEFLLDHLKVPQTTTSKKTGKQVSLDLNARIQMYEKSNPGHGETFHALRVIGNLGSHDSTLTREALLDAFEIYEHALSEIIGGWTAYLDTIKKKIISNKGKY